MKKYLKEIVIFLLQLFMFYIFPLFAGPTDAMGMVFIIIIVTLLLAVILGFVTKRKIKYYYPVLVALSFIPTIWIYYNESALVHSVWYLVISSVGLIIGSFINRLLVKKS